METESILQDCATAATRLKNTLRAALKMYVNWSRQKYVPKHRQENQHRFWFCGRCEQEIVERGVFAVVKL